MRELKFRAFDNLNGLMSSSFTPADSWIEFKTGTGGVLSVPTHNINTCTHVTKEGKIAPRLEIEQFTGLKDKNGVEIYEGDTVELHIPVRTTQTHYGENIPRPDGMYTELLEPEIKTEAFVVKFKNGTFYLKEDELVFPMFWDLIDYNTRTDLTDAWGDCSNWVDPAHPGEDDLGYLLEQYPPNSEEELMKYVSGCEVIGNIHEEKSA